MEDLICCFCSKVISEVCDFVCNMLQDFWFGVAVFFIAAVLGAFLCGGVVGILVGAKWRSLCVDNTPEDTGDFVYVCSSKPSCYHMVAVCGGVTMKPLKQCDHCSKIKKRNR